MVLLPGCKHRADVVHQGDPCDQTLGASPNRVRPGWTTTKRAASFSPNAESVVAPFPQVGSCGRGRLTFNLSRYFASCPFPHGIARWCRLQNAKRAPPKAGQG